MGLWGCHAGWDKGSKTGCWLYTTTNPTHAKNTTQGNIPGPQGQLGQRQYWVRKVDAALSTWYHFLPYFEEGNPAVNRLIVAGSNYFLLPVSSGSWASSTGCRKTCFQELDLGVSENHLQDNSSEVYSLQVHINPGCLQIWSCSSKSSDSPGIFPGVRITQGVVPKAFFFFLSFLEGSWQYLGEGKENESCPAVILENRNQNWKNPKVVSVQTSFPCENSNITLLGLFW